MPVYEYEAADSLGRKVRDSLEAEDEYAARGRLGELGLTPLSIKAATEKKGFTLSLGHVSRKDLLTFTQELGNLLESGLPIDRAVYVLSVHSEKEALRKVVEAIYMDLQRGLALSQAMAKHSVFPSLYVNMIRAGEAGGILESVIKRLAVFLETSVEFQEELTTALVYPAILTVVGGLAVAFIMIFVVPRFSVMFEDMGQSIPLPTQMLISMSAFLISYWWLIMAVCAGLFVLARSYAATAEGRLFVDTMKLRLPLVQGLHMKALIARFSRTLGTLLESGVPILQAIMISREVVGNSVVSERLTHLEEGVRKGRGVSAPLRECGVFPSIVVQMIAVGEEAGRLEQTFLSVAKRFEAESTSMIKRTMSLIAPVLILLMSALVAFIVVSMLLAVFSVNDIPI